jgi:hypothetical protein
MRNSLYLVVPFAALTVLALGCSRQPTGPQELSGTEAVAEHGSGRSERDRGRGFVPWSDHRYFPLVPGTVFHYRSRTDEGLEITTVTVTHRTKRIDGVTTRVVEDVVERDGEIVERTHDWFAMDRRGNVWYFGEDSREYEDGKVVSTDGSWMAGRDGARAGIIMKARPRVGDTYHEEVAPGVAEDQARVVSVDERLKTRLGTFRRVLKTENFTPLEPDAVEHKYYAPGVGLVREVADAGQGAVNDLVRVSKSGRHRDHDDD